MLWPTRRRKRRRPTPSLAQALALGALHGPAELLPVSSSAHVATLAWLRGWSYAELDDGLRKSFEVALHAGTAAAYLLVGGRELLPRTPHAAALLVLATAPPAAAGLLLERPIEERLGTPSTVAAGLAIGAVAMVVADRGPQRRPAQEATAVDALWLGIAQATALMPGVSRSGATLAVARARGFTRQASRRLSVRAGLPVLVGATTLKLVRVLDRSRDERVWLATGAAASFLSTLLVGPLAARIEDHVPLAPFAAYRMMLARSILARQRRASRPK